MKPVAVTLNIYIYILTLVIKLINNKDPEFKIGDNFRISKYENIFAKVYALNWSEEVFVKNTYTYLISDLIVEETVGRFYIKEFQKTNQKEFRIEKSNQVKR